MALEVLDPVLDEVISEHPREIVAVGSFQQGGKVTPKNIPPVHCWFELSMQAGRVERKFACCCNLYARCKLPLTLGTLRVPT